MDIPKEYELLVLNGELPGAAELRKICASARRIVATDGAANTLHLLRIAPHVVVGDFDSISPQAHQGCTKSQFVEDPDQNFSDFDKAISFLKNSGCRRLAVVGMSGGRYDHQTINLSIAARYSRLMEMWLFEKSGIGELISALDGPATRSYVCSQKQLVSMVGLPEAQNVVTRGLNRALNGESLRFANFDSLSNFAVSEEISVTLQSGQVMVYFPRHGDLRGGATRKRGA